LLAAFLTVVQVWQIPPAENPLAPPIPGSVPSEAATPSQPRVRGPANAGFEPSPFASNFGKTILSGLAGLAATTVLKSLEGQPSGTDQEFYIIWFVILFFALLTILGIVRGLAEALRSRFALVYFPLARPAEPRTQNAWLRAVRSTLYGFDRFINWVISLRVALLTFIDTFINLIQGKNQTMTRIFADAIVEQHRNVIRVADTVRIRLTKVIEGVPTVKPGTVRVNISVLSADQTRVFYISRAQGSPPKEFSKHSVAWVSVFTGSIRWYKASYLEQIKDIELFDNTRGTIPNDNDTIPLRTYYQERGQDYAAFALFPFPWPQRGFGSPYVKGAVHVSFRSQEDFEKIWRVPDPSNTAWSPSDVYKDSPSLLELTGEETGCLHEEIRTALLDAIAVLGELLRGFNENIYLNSGAE
jgi:hypothetical protein